MPIIKSAKKALRQNRKRRVVNLRKKREIKNLGKQIRVLTEKKAETEARKLLPTIYKKLDKAAKTNLIKKNKAARLKSRITRNINSKLRPAKAPATESK